MATRWDRAVLWGESQDETPSDSEDVVMLKDFTLLTKLLTDKNKSSPQYSHLTSHTYLLKYTRTQV